MNEFQDFLPTSAHSHIEQAQADIQRGYTHEELLRLIEDSTEANPNAEFTPQQLDLETAE